MIESKKQRKIMVLVLIMGLVVLGLSSCGGEKKEDGAVIKLSVAADDHWTEKSTPAIAHITGKDEHGKKVDIYHAVYADENESSVKVNSGEYTTDIITPVNEDRSLFKVKKKVDKKGRQVSAELQYVKADKVPEKVFNETIEEIKQAVEHGDKSFEGERGEKILDIVNKVESAKGEKPETSDSQMKHEHNVLPLLLLNLTWYLLK